MASERRGLCWLSCWAGRPDNMPPTRGRGQNRQPGHEACHKRPHWCLHKDPALVPTPVVKLGAQPQCPGGRVPPGVSYPHVPTAIYPPGPPGPRERIWLWVCARHGSRTRGGVSNRGLSGLCLKQLQHPTPFEDKPASATASETRVTATADGHKMEARKDPRCWAQGQMPVAQRTVPFHSLMPVSFGDCPMAAVTVRCLYASPTQSSVETAPLS